MKRVLILISMALVISCNNETVPYVTHISQIDSIVSANNNMKDLESLLSGYEANHDDAGKMVVMRELGKIYRESSDFKTALDYHEKSLSLAKELKDTLNIIDILNQLGTDFRRLGILDEAAVKHYEALSYCEKYSDRTSSRAQKKQSNLA